MRIQDIMSRPVIVCGRNDTLNAAARLMWEHDCGVVPVVDDDGRIAGIVTDRDICMAAYTQGRILGEIPVAVAMSGRVLSCRADDSLESAERVMSDNQVRRLPVLDKEDRPVGLVSYSDVVRHASTMAHGDGVDFEVIRGLAAITRPRQAQAAAAPPLAMRPDLMPRITKGRRPPRASA